jgi:hypothetical protein
MAWEGENQRLTIRRADDEWIFSHGSNALAKAATSFKQSI